MCVCMYVHTYPLLDSFEDHSVRNTHDSKYNTHRNNVPCFEIVNRKSQFVRIGVQFDTIVRFVSPIVNLLIRFRIN